MGKIYRNGELYTADANTFSIELTWAEYCALNQSEKMNGTFYYITDIDSFMDKAGYGFTPIGTIISVMGNHAPNNYLICDGTVYNIADYPELANYFKTEFGSYNKFGGDGTTTFAVPDLQGEFLRGTGINSHANCGNGLTVGVHQDPTLHVRAEFGSDNKLYVNGKGNNVQAGNTDSYVSTYTENGRGIWNRSTEDTYSLSKQFYTSRPTNTSVLYCISYKNIYITTVPEENIYSTDEKVIGQWIDGKPLYQKTLSCGALPNNTTSSINHNIDNIDYVTNFYGTAKDTGGSFIHFDACAVGSSTTADTQLLVNSTIIRFKTGTDRSSFTESYVTLQYTKTTD